MKSHLFKAFGQYRNKLHLFVQLLIYIYMYIPYIMKKYIYMYEKVRECCTNYSHANA